MFGELSANTCLLIDPQPNQYRSLAAAQGLI
jgi:hypothetical protein